jgi:UDP-N-acetylglucosamine 2-epimerase (non-hydrolysing)
MDSANIAVLIGTRPGIVKMSPIVDELRERDVPHLIIHSGQHYSLAMDRKIMEDVGLSKADYQILRPLDCISHAQQTAYMLTGIEEVLLKERPDILLVCGDANTNMAGALAARKIHVRVGHVEAGLRSFDWRMPEEHNRIIIDHISEYLFAPSHRAKENLLRDGVRGEVFVVGNTIVEATLKYSEVAKEKKSPKLSKMTRGEPYVLLTLHREENVDNEQVLSEIVAAIGEICEDHEIRIVFPIHPRTKKRLREFGIEKQVERISNLELIEPLGYLEFLACLSNATLVMTDSGGIQEESCILKVPCITIRESTERQETIQLGSNHLAGTQRDKIVRVFNSVFKLSDLEKKWRNPYGDGKASKRIVDTCLNGRPENEFQTVKSE